MRKSHKYFTNFLLAIFAWFFLVQPFFAFSAHPQSDKTTYYQAGGEDAFDSGVYFEISKEDNDADVEDFDKSFESNFLVNSQVFSFHNSYYNKAISKFYSLQNYSELRCLYLLNKIFRI
ncbi:MAG: hypothetical protein V4667_09645 [Bacteroidota bacterium]